MEKEQTKNQDNQVSQNSETENSKKNMSEEREAYLKSSQIAYCVAIIMIAIFEIVYAFIDKYNVEFILLFSSITGVYNLVLGILKVKNYKIFLTCGIALIVIALGLAVLWILGLAGVAI